MAEDTFGSILDETAAALARAGDREPRRRARRLIAAALDIAPGELLVHAERRLEPSAAAHLRGLAGRAAQGEPPSRILGKREFWGLDFALSRDTLDPRPDSEAVVEAVLARQTDRLAELKLLDLGTGTGCLLCALLREFPLAEGVGVDLSEEAAATARRNARALGVAGRARFLVGNWGDALAAHFDVIVANPPYIATAALAALPPEVARYDPRRALDGGVDGLDAYRRFAPRISVLLSASGFLAAEVGADQASDVAKILCGCGLFIEAIERDLAGIERCLVARLALRQKKERSPAGQKNVGMCRRRV